MKFGLNERQAKFCEFYIASGNGTDACIKAGYSEKSAKQIASVLLKKDNIQEYINHLNEKIRSQRIADSAECQERLTQIIRGELQEEVIAVVKNESGEPKATTVTKPTGINNIIKAIEILSKIQFTTVENTAEVVKFVNEDKIQD